jgi:hypothetical protein
VNPVLERIGDILGTLAGLFETKAQLVARDIEQVGALVGVYLLAGCIGVIGCVAMLAGFVAMLAEVMGIAGALVLAGITATVLALGIVGVARWISARRGRASREDLEYEAEEQIARLTDPGDAEPDSPLEAVASEVAKAIAANPKAAASAAFAALAVLGPDRIMRVVARTTAAASVAASLSSLVRELHSATTPSEDTPRPSQATTHNGTRGAASGTTIPRTGVARTGSRRGAGS